MKRTLLGALSALALALPLTAAADGPERLVTVVTSENAQTQLMAMVLTMQAAQAGAETRVLLCGPGGDIALKDAPETATAGQPPRDMSPQGLLRALMSQQGARVEVCAIYLPGRGEGPEVLIDGVGVAQPPEMAGALMGDDTRVLSF